MDNEFYLIAVLFALCPSNVDMMAVKGLLPHWIFDVRLWSFCRSNHTVFHNGFGTFFNNSSETGIQRLVVEYFH